MDNVLSHMHVPSENEEELCFKMIANRLEASPLRTDLTESKIAVSPNPIKRKVTLSPNAPDVIS